jgi:adenylosuccinate lyase
VKKQVSKPILRVELACLQSNATHGVVPTSDYSNQGTILFDLRRKRKLKAITKQDVIAFTRAISRAFRGMRKSGSL